MGIDELRERIFKERKFLIASATYPGGDPRSGARERRRAAPASARASPPTAGSRSSSAASTRTRSGSSPTSCADGPTAPSARTRTAGSATSPASSSADSPASSATSTSRCRITNRQNFVLRGLRDDQLPRAVRTGSSSSTWPTAGAELARDVVSCPGADTCNLAVTQSRGLAADIDRALEDAGLAEVGGVRINISGCTNSCGQHHISDIGFFGLERRAHGRCGAGLPDAARRARRRHGDRVRREGDEAARQGRVRGRRAGRRTVRPRARSRRDVLRLARPLRRRRAGRRPRSRTSTSSPSPTPPPSTTSTSTRPAPTWPRSATASARHDRRPRPRDRHPRRDGRAAGDCPRRARRARPRGARDGRTRPRDRAGGRGDRMGLGPVRSRRRPRGVVPGLRAHRPGDAGGPRDRGRVPRHPVPLRRDALVRRAGARALRPEPQRGLPRCRSRQPVGPRPRFVLCGAQGRAAPSAPSRARPRGSAGCAAARRRNARTRRSCRTTSVAAS